MGILTSFEKQAFAVENGNSTKWESGPPDLMFKQKWESGTQTTTTKLCIFIHFKHLCVNFEHLCGKTLFCGRKHKGENTQTSKECSFQTSVC